MMSKLILLPIILLVVIKVPSSNCTGQLSNLSDNKSLKINGSQFNIELPTNGHQSNGTDSTYDFLEDLAECEGLEYSDTFDGLQLRVTYGQKNETNDLFISQFNELYGPTLHNRTKRSNWWNPYPISPDYSNDFKRIEEKLKAMMRALDIPEKDPITFATALQTVTLTGVAVFSIIITIVNTVMSIYTIYDPTQIGVKLITITNQLSMQITMIEQGFSNIDRKIDLLREDVQDTATKTEFKRNEADVKNLNTLFIRFLSTPFEHTMEDLKRECAANKMIFFAEYIMREIRSNDHVSLKTMMSRRNDLRKFGTWSKLIGQSLTKAMFLHGYCLGVRITDNSTMKAVVTHDKKLFFRAIEELGQFIRTEAKRIQKDYMRFVGEEVRKYATDHQDEDHQDFARQVHRILREKYYFRYWYVISYKGTTYGPEYHGFTTRSNVFSWVRELNRCVYISSTNSRVDVERKLKNCISKQKNKSGNWYWSAETIWKDIKGCVEPYNGLIVVRGTEDARSTFTSGTYTYIWTTRDMFLFEYKRDYFVHLMPAEIDEY